MNAVVAIVHIHQEVLQVVHQVVILLVEADTQVEEAAVHREVVPDQVHQEVEEDNSISKTK